MRIILSLALLCFTVAVRADDIQWFNGDLAQAQAAAQQQQRNLLVVVHATWCGPCHVLLEQTLPTPELAKLVNDRTVPVLIDGDKNRPIVKQFQIFGYPTILILRPNGDEVSRPNAEQDPQKLLKLLTEALDHGRTLKELQAALAADPTNPQLKYELLKKHSFRVEVDLALEYKTRLEKEHPDFYAKVREELLGTVALACEMGGRLALAIDFYREQLTIATVKDVRQFAQSRIVSLLYRSGKADEAMDQLELSIREYADEIYWYEAYLQLAHNEKLHLDRAVNYGKTAKTLKSLSVKRSASIRYWLAVVYKDLNQIAEARVEIDEAIAIDPQDVYKKFRDSLET